MDTAKKFLAITFIIILATAACNLPSQAPGTSTPSPDAAGETVTALLLTLTAETSQPTDTPIPSSTPFPSQTPTITLTSTPTVPVVRVSTDTNCRTGPGVVYDRVGVLLVGEQAVVVGKFSAGNYWIINNPDSSGTCWLWGEYATVSGNTGGLPEYTAPPTPTPTYTPTPTVPDPPANLSANKICTPVGPNFSYQFVLSWEDKASNEEGYRVYVNGALAGTLPANTVVYPNVFGVLAPGVPVTYEVEAFNATGSSAKKSIVVSCP